MPFQIIRNDITKVKADAIVNTANPEPKYGTGTDQAIYLAAGEKKLLKARQEIGYINPGYVAHTPAFKLKAKYIIHAVGPVWIDGNHDEEKVLQSCYERSLQLAEQLQCNSVAFPLMATGNYGFPHDKAIRIAINALQSYAMMHTMTIYLVVFGETATELSKMIYGKIKEYVDENYVEDAKEREYRAIRDERERDFYRSSRIAKKQPSTRKETTSEGIVIEFSDDTLTFQEKLLEHMRRKDATNASLYKPAGISAAAFSKIMSDRLSHPLKNTIICFCVSLNLTINETMDLLARAGYTLSINDKRDMVIKACIEYGYSDVQKIDNVLADYGFDYIGKY